MKSLKVNKPFVLTAIAFACYYSVELCAIGFATVFLRDEGVSKAGSGTIVAASCIIAALLQPALGRLCDKIPKLDWKRMSTVMALILLACFTGSLLTKGAVLVAFYFAVIIFPLCINPFLNESCFYYGRRGINVNFGVVRGLGSFAYAGVSLLLQYADLDEEPKWIVFTGALATVALLISVLLLPRVERKVDGGAEADELAAEDAGAVGSRTQEVESDEKEVAAATEDAGADDPREQEVKPDEKEVVAATDDSVTSTANETVTTIAEESKAEEILDAGKNKLEGFFTFIKNNKLYMIFWLSMILVFTFHNLYSANIIDIIHKAHGNVSNMSVALSIGALIEVPTMCLCSRFLKKVPAGVLMMIGAFFYIVRCILFMVAESVMTVYIAQMLQIVTYGIFFPASVYLTDKLIDEKYSNTGQAMTAFTLTTGTVIGYFLGGEMMEYDGINALLIAGLIITICGFVSALIGCLVSRKTHKKNMSKESV